MSSVARTNVLFSDAVVEMSIRNLQNNYQSTVAKIICHHDGWIQRSKVQSCNGLLIKSSPCLQNLKFMGDINYSKIRMYNTKEIRTKLFTAPPIQKMVEKLMKVLFPLR